MRHRDYSRRRTLSAKRKKARKLREERRRICLLSLQKLPAKKLETVFKKVVRGELELIGLEEDPDQGARFSLFHVEEEII